jgi:hypothetical protein
MNVVERLSDRTHWTPAGDCPFPIFGWNFVGVKVTEHKFLMFRWSKRTKDFSRRWITHDGNAFAVIELDKP